MSQTLTKNRRTVSKPTSRDEMNEAQLSIAERYEKTFPVHKLDIETWEIEFFRHKRYVEHSNVPEDKCLFSFDNMDIDPDQQKIVNLCKDFCESPYKLLFLCSRWSGIGKTRVAINLMHHFYHEYKVETEKAELINDKVLSSCYFLEEAEYKKLIQDYKNKFKSPYDLNTQLLKLDMLVLDEFFNDNPDDYFPYVYNLLHSCIEKDNTPKIILTTNIARKEFMFEDSYRGKFYDNRLASRLSNTNIVNLIDVQSYNKDWRAK